MDLFNLESLVQLVLGCIALFAGRNIFWLFIGVAGFLVGYEFAGVWLDNSPVIVQIAAGLGTGLIGAVLAILFERVAFSLAGFYAAAYLAVMMVGRAGFDSDQTVLIVVAGLAGAVLAALLMDWAIIALSSLVGAAAIVQILPASTIIEAILFIVLVVIGISVQRAVFVRNRSS